MASLVRSGKSDPREASREGKREVKWRWDGSKREMDQERRNFPPSPTSPGAPGPSDTPMAALVL